MTTIDPLLASFLATDEGSAEELEALETLATRAQPVVRSVLRSKGAGSAAELEEDELLSEVFVRLLRSLRASKRRGEAPADFSGYVAVIAYNVLHSRSRQKHRTRKRLRTRIRFVLEDLPHFAVWDTPRGAVAGGLAKWNGGEVTSADVSCASRGSVELLALTREQLAGALDAIFAESRAPVELERLVEAVAACFHLELGPEEVALPSGDVMDAGADVEETLASRSHLGVLWNEIELLPERQRTALLLNLRDSSGAAALNLLVLLGIATLGRIAAALGWTEQALASVWDELPFDDRRIAERLAITRQQVINLRKSARDRLARRTVISTAGGRRSGVKP